MATLETYLSLAEEVYARKSNAGQYPEVDDKSFLALQYKVRKWEWATWHGDGYQGAVYAAPNDTEWIVAFSGTKGGLTSAPSSQTSANVRIGLQVIPNMAGSANAMVRWAKKEAGTRPVTVVGHSLGGALAQVVGQWTGCPFISFNGPGMRAQLALSAFNLFKPQQLVRSASVLRKHVDGYCYRIEGDFVGNFGMPLGLPRTYTSTRTDKHSLDTLRFAIPQAELNADPFA